MRKDIEELGKLPKQYYIVGDEAFSTTDQLLTPWSGHGLGPWKDSFNYHLSAMRQTIERAFGIFGQRWGVFWRPLRVDYHKWQLLPTVCAKLHNLCIDDPESVDPGPRWFPDLQDGEQMILLTNDGESERGFSGDRRREITRFLEEQGIRRPPHASRNSRA